MKPSNAAGQREQVIFEVISKEQSKVNTTEDKMN